MHDLYVKFAAQFGEVSSEGARFALSDCASLTNRVFPGWYGDAKEGEEYISEWAAPGIDPEGHEVVVHWQFYLVKGAEPEDSLLDWDDVEDVVFA